VQIPTAPGPAEPPSARPATTEDIDALSRSHLQATEVLEGHRGGSHLVAQLRRGQTTAEVSTSFATALAEPSTRVLAGCLGTTVVGHAVVDLPAGDAPVRTAEIVELWVHPGARGVGVGGALLDASRRTAFEADCTGLDSLALPGDRDTKNFFEDHAMVARAIRVHTSISG